MELKVDESLMTILDAISEGITIIDIDGKVIFGNKAYCNFIGLERENLIGAELKKIRSSAKLPEVIQSGENLMHVERKENGEYYFVNMYSVYSKDRVIGGISVVTFFNEAFDFKKQIEQLEKKMETKILRINKANSARYKFESITGVSKSMVDVKNTAMQVAETDMTVLLESETGTGKELFANAIHNFSLRKNEVFIAINCANFRGEILDSELFGYVEGAFTGAKKGGKMGLFEAAHKGTLFLDEISEMDISLQAKLLRALQENIIRPVGSVTDIPVDVRIICASNANLKAYVKEGKFRADLYYRLSVFPIKIPPLRERVEDISVITIDQLKNISKKLKRVIRIDQGAMEVLKKYHWPGNVRELVNVLEFSSFKAKDGLITLECLPESLYAVEEINTNDKLSERVRAFEKREILKELNKYGADTEGKRKAAKKLGISLASLYNKIGD
ncbi:sigma-54 interaction domain-containing protein [Alkaliphilus oremlandii]|uniref:Putative sigma54 specific transcriptional regulator n=1 Tax=Alkaliphilus oremlandii (strain OhILAs) TaxID=350688 RepID=A8MHR4_ALKOO|nr:sigma 54-interacting transcriptional regulator [Alkaliphilus oremlandii]ABW19346.1 putative sigma54 specific transcriptional regulator [Alkaliphilus oremlandii OhILAs]